MGNSIKGLMDQHEEDNKMASVVIHEVPAPAKYGKNSGFQVEWKNTSRPQAYMMLMSLTAAIALNDKCDKNSVVAELLNLINKTPMTQGEDDDDE